LEYTRKQINVLGGTHIPDVGYRYEIEGKVLIVGTTVLVEDLTPEQAFVLIDAIDELDASIEAEELMIPNPPRRPVVQEFINVPIYKQSDHSTLYKFVSRSLYDAYYKSGTFRFGTLASYRPLEMTGHPAGDRLEGKAYCRLDAPGRSYFAGVRAGVDRYIASFTHDLKDRRYMSRKFGPVILEFDAPRFLERSVEELAADKAYAGEIRYADLKLVCGATIGGVQDENLPFIDRILFDEFYRLAEPATTFVKPRRFSREREVRLAFKMNGEVGDPRTVTFHDHEQLWRRIA